jgi:hypothetical protein
MTCPKCKAAILPNDETINGFHDPCYQQWLFELYRELNGTSVKVATATGSR